MKTFLVWREDKHVVYFSSKPDRAGAFSVTSHGWSMMFGPLPVIGAPPREYRLELVKRANGGKFKATKTRKS